MSPIAAATPRKPWSGTASTSTWSVDKLMETKKKLEAAGIEVLGPTNHTIFKSICFFDPNGHRVELAADCGTPQMHRKLDEVKWEMLEEWSRTKRAPKHAAWMHDGSHA
jgi:lactoylglutathione lyase